MLKNKFVRQKGNMMPMSLLPHVNLEVETSSGLLHKSQDFYMIAKG